VISARSQPNSTRKGNSPKQITSARPTRTRFQSRHGGSLIAVKQPHEIRLRLSAAAPDALKEFDGVTLTRFVDAGRQEHAAVDENIRPAVGRLQKSETALAIKPIDTTPMHGHPPSPA
jgi:hypothetical protein